jgi:transposase
MKISLPFIPREGQPGLPAWRLALVTVLQFLENLSDRQAAEAVRARIDWKYALGMELSDTGFDFSVLSEFRERLIKGEAEQILLDRMLAHFKDKGLLKARGRQRTGSTHVLASVRVMNRPELVAETLRVTLNPLPRSLRIGCACSPLPIGTSATLIALRSRACPKGKQHARVLLSRWARTASPSCFRAWYAPGRESAGYQS